MNWKNVLQLISVDIKSSRMIRGTRFRRFRENRAVTYALYIAACVFGLLVGWLVGNFYNGISDSNLRQLILEGATNLFITLPTIALLYSLVFTQMSQIQRIGAKASIQPLYWFPITWKEHTLASILANLIGAPFIITVFICSSIFVASVFLGLASLAVFTMFALLGSLFLASITTEILKVLQVRILGAVTKVAGRTAIWVRLLGTIIFFIIFYIAYFTLISGASFPALIESLAGGQRILWFIPYLWLGIGLSAFVSGLSLEAIIFPLASLAFIYALFLAAARLNVRFGLYEAPSITISRGPYIPKTGLLGRLGFSSMEAAIIRKDFRAFTRRRELMYIFIMPIVFIIVPFLSSMRGTVDTTMPSAFYSFLFAYLTLLPGTLMAISLGSITTGSEGGSVWYVYSSPIPVKGLVKAKYFFATLFSFAVTLICFFISALLMSPSPRMAGIGLTEAILLVFSLGMVSLSFGIRGADFREFPRPRMIRPLWGFINVIVCILLALAVISPMIPYGLKILSDAQAPIAISISLPESYLYVALPLSVVIASVITYVFHRIAVKNAEELLLKAET
ncbi:MAG: hypothetical protein WAN82_06980 [Candidatus Bathyarchaeia archaeon]